MHPLVLPVLVPLGRTLLARTGEEAPADGLPYRALESLTTIAVGVATRKVLVAAWEKATGTTPPDDPSDPGIDWQEALTWGAAAGVGVGVGRVVARRLTAEAWTKAVGRSPYERR